MIYVLNNNNSLTQKDGMLKIIFNIEQMKLFSFFLLKNIYFISDSIQTMFAGFVSQLCVGITCLRQTSHQ